MVDDDKFRLLVRGDAEAFRYFYDKHVGLVQYIGFRFGVSAEEKDDLVQEVFLKLLNVRAKLQGPDQLAAWLATAARNWLIDRGRKLKRHARIENPGSVPGGPSRLADKRPPRGEAVFSFELQNGPMAPDEAVSRSLTAELVRDLAGQMEGQAGYEDFVAFYFEEKSVDEIVRSNGEAAGTVTSRLTRMRAKFRALFEAKYGRDDV